jgi:hypothetical protein
VAIQPDRPDSPLAEAIFRTLLYADVFSFPMTEAEIQHFLIGFASTPADIRATLERSAWLSERVVCIDGYWLVHGGASNADLRQQRNVASEALWPVARRCGLILAHLPFVRMVALTGALAVRNASTALDDIDYLLVTTPGRVWIARALAVLVVRIARLWHIGLCPNYVLSETALLQDRRDLFTAHELAQMVPLAGFSIYEAMRDANAWAAPMLPNAAGPFYAEADFAPHGLGRFVQRLGEIVLGGAPGNALERWEQNRKLRKFHAQSLQPNSSAQLDQDHIKGHFNDYGYPALDKYQQRLRVYDLETDQALSSTELSNEAVASPVNAE